MKRVRYLAGAVGLTPVAFGMATAQPAQAVPVKAAAPAQAGKAVSLQHMLGSGHAMTRAGASSSVPPAPHSSATVSEASSAAPGTACFASVEAAASHGNLTEHFWFATDGCIGTVSGRMAYNKTIHKCMWAKIFPAGQATKSLTSVCRTVPAGESLIVRWHPHRKFGRPTEVCVYSTYDQTHGACSSASSFTG